MSIGNEKNDYLPLSACFWLVLVCAVWGANAVSIKFSNQGVPPLTAAALRSCVSGVLVWAFALWKGQSILFPVGKRHHAVVIGVLFGLDFLFLYWGISFTPASRSTIFLYSQPLWVIIGAHFALKEERLYLGKIAGAILAFCGLLIVFQTRSPELPDHHWIGDLMEITAAIFWAATTIYIKRVSRDTTLNHYQTLFAQLIFAVPVLALAAFFFEKNTVIHLTPVVLGALAYQSIIVAFISYLFWFWMIHKYSVGKLASFTFLAPIFGVLFGAVILSEPVGFPTWCGLSLVCMGIYLANKTTPSHKAGKLLTFRWKHLN